MSHSITCLKCVPYTNESKKCSSKKCSSKKCPSKKCLSQKCCGTPLNDIENLYNNISIKLECLMQKWKIYCKKIMHVLSINYKISRIYNLKALPQVQSQFCTLGLTI